MEIPYGGRATINTQFDHVEITIPARKNWLVILFLGFWLCIWTAGETFALVMVVTLGSEGAPPAIFIAVWLCMWTAGGVFAFRKFWWQLKGMEIIQVGQGELTVSYKGALFVKSKTYDLNEARNFRVQEDYISYQNMMGPRLRGGFFNIADTGTIRFDYGMKTVKLGNGLEEAEALHLLQMLENKKVLTSQNFTDN